MGRPRTVLVLLSRDQFGKRALSSANSQASTQVNQVEPRRCVPEIHSIFRSLFSSNTEHPWNGFNEMWNQNTVINYYQIVWISSQLHPCYSLTEGSVTQSIANPDFFRRLRRRNFNKKMYQQSVWSWGVCMNEKAVEVSRAQTRNRQLYTYALTINSTLII